jgi:hypothetical protein
MYYSVNTRFQAVNLQVSELESRTAQETYIHNSHFRVKRTTPTRMFTVLPYDAIALLSTACISKMREDRNLRLMRAKNPVKKLILSEPIISAYAYCA